MCLSQCGACGEVVRALALCVRELVAQALLAHTARHCRCPSPNSYTNAISAHRCDFDVVHNGQGRVMPVFARGCSSGRERERLIAGHGARRASLLRLYVFRRRDALWRERRGGVLLLLMRGRHAAATEPLRTKRQQPASFIATCPAACSARRARGSAGRGECSRAGAAQANDVYRQCSEYGKHNMSYMARTSLANRRRTAVAMPTRYARRDFCSLPKTLATRTRS